MKSNEFVSLLRGATFVFLCRFTGAALAFATQVFLARWMGAEQTGVYVFAFSVCVLLTTVAGLGFPAAAIRFIGAALAEDRGDRVVGFARRSRQVALTLGVTATISGALFVVLTAGLVPTDRREPLLLAFLTVPFFALLNARSSVALGLSWFPMAFLPNTVLRPLLFFLLIGGVWLFSSSLSASKAMLLQLLAIAAVMALQIVVVAMALRRRFSVGAPAFDTPVWLRTAAPLLVITLFTNYFLELNVFIAGTLLGNGELAVFNASFRTAALIAFGLFAVDAITMPRISKSHAAGDTAGLQRTVTQAARLRFFGSLAAAVPLVFLGKPVLALFGERFVAGYESLLILAAAQVLSAAFGPAARILSVTGYQNQCLRVFAVSLLAMIALHPLLIQQFGPNGAALTVVVVVNLQSIWLFAMVRRCVGVHASPFYVRPVR